MTSDEDIEAVEIAASLLALGTLYHSSSCPSKRSIAGVHTHSLQAPNQHSNDELCCSSLSLLQRYVSTLRITELGKSQLSGEAIPWGI